MLGTINGFIISKMANVLVGITGDVRETLNFYDKIPLRFSFQLLCVVQSGKIAKLCSVDRNSRDIIYRM